MKICRFDNDRLGVIVDGMVRDVTAAQNEIRAAHPYDAKSDAIIAALPEWRSRLADMAVDAAPITLESVNLLPPVARPGKLMAAPVNYKAHIDEAQADPGIRHIERTTKIREAGIFLKSNTALIGAGGTIPIRFPDRRNDHEFEFVIVIGSECSRVKQADALDVIAGYTLGLDMTVRGPEDRSARKSCDGYAVLGPWFVTADEIADPDDVSFRGAVNGDIKQDANTKDQVLSIRELIEYASEYYTLYPGDVMYTGSPEGVSEVKAGDELHFVCDQIGEFRIGVGA
ncbi:MAG TPA: FAA hydrolase family protein [Rhodospirillaceae bacterium]|nr:FAA hydrolase family protein [Rhodospirillaceae bacterium]|tara:strand:- start:2 stop:856 length:855 start_codon:yes stop_codon:yes gene_type:complete